MGYHVKLAGLVIASLCLGVDCFTVHNSGLACQCHTASLISSRNIERKNRLVVGRSSLVKPEVALFGLPVEAAPWIEIAGILGGGALLTIYHLRLFLRDRSGEHSWRSVQASTREMWSKHVRETESWLYAIQTLRNAITAQTFLASTVLSLLTVISGRLWEILKQPSSGIARQTFIAQFVSVAASMLTSAYCFLQSARLMTHAGFMFPVHPSSTQVDRIMRKSENSQWLGLRCLYISAAFLSWIVGGPRMFFIASFLLTGFFRSIDQAPKGISNQEPL
jgi:hypothetical protein